METERIELSDGAWVVIKTQMTHGARKAMQAQFPSGSKVVDDKPVDAEGNPLPDEVADKANDALILNSVVEWSLGDIGMEALDTLAEVDYLKLLGRLVELQALPLAEMSARG